VLDAALAGGRIDRDSDRVDGRIIGNGLTISSKLASGKIDMPASDTNSASSSCDACSGRIVNRCLSISSGER
jgi:hypothetical protein